MMSAGAGAALATGTSTTDWKICSTDVVYAVLSLPNFRLPRSWTLSLSAAARRTTPAASAAGADFILVICGWRRSMELGRLGPMMMAAVAAPARIFGLGDAYLKPLWSPTLRS